MKLADAVDGLLMAIQADGAKLETVTWCQHRFRRLVQAFGDRDIRRIKVDDVRAYIVQMRDMGFSPYTLYTLVRVARRLFKWLYDEGKIESDFRRQIKLPKLPQPVPRAIEMPDVIAMLRKCPDDVRGLRDRAIILFLLDTGCRVGGLCGLRVQDVDLGHMRAKIFEKGDRTRIVLFGNETANALSAWLSVRPFPRNDAVFTSLTHDRPANPDTVTQLLRRLKRRSGVNGRANPHAFRHAFAREYILNGGDLASVSEMLGHSQIAVTKQFSAVFQAEELRAKHDAFSPVSRLRLGDDDRSMGMAG